MAARRDPPHLRGEPGGSPSQLRPAAGRAAGTASIRTLGTKPSFMVAAVWPPIVDDERAWPAVGENASVRRGRPCRRGGVHPSPPEPPGPAPTPAQLPSSL